MFGNYIHSEHPKDLNVNVAIINDIVNILFKNAPTQWIVCIYMLHRFLAMERSFVET